MAHEILKTQNAYIVKADSNTKVVITKQDIDDIMASAMEGGITYWCADAVTLNKEGNLEFLGEYPSEQISRGGVLKLFDFDDESYMLTAYKLLNGIRLWLKSVGGDTSTYLAELDEEHQSLVNLKGNVKMLDIGYSIDAIVCDSIIQFALFGELVFC